MPLLVVCTARPELLERRPGWGGGKPNALTISLSPLSDDETARLLGTLLERSVLPADVQASLLARAGGNPLYAEQFARLLAEADARAELAVARDRAGDHRRPARRAPGRREAAAPGRGGARQGLLARRSLRRSAGSSAAKAEERLHALERKEFVRRERRSSVGGESEYAFRHVLVRDVAYGQIPRRRERRAAPARGGVDRVARAPGGPRGDAGAPLPRRRSSCAGPPAQTRAAELAARARSAARERATERSRWALSRPQRGCTKRRSSSRPEDDAERPELLLAYARSRVDDTALDDSVLLDATEGLLRAGKVEAARPRRTHGSRASG